MRNLTLFSLLNLALRYAWILILCALVFAIGTFSYCEFVATPIYSATGSVLVTNGAILSQQYKDYYENDSTLNNTDIVASINFADTINDILNTNGIFKQLAAKTDNKYSYSELASRATVKRKSESSLFISVSFKSNEKAEAILLVNEFLDLTPSYIKEFVPSTAAVSTSVADTASKVSPNTMTSTGLAGIIGACLAYGIIVIIYSMNTTITNEDDFKEHFDIDVLASIPDFAAARTEKYYKHQPYYAYYGMGGTDNGNKQTRKENQN